jgi:hypothetical protein
LRKVRDLDLEEVSLLDKTKRPAYEGTLVMVRADEGSIFYGETFEDEINIREEATQEQLEQPEADEQIDYGEWESLINDMKK